MLSVRDIRWGKHLLISDPSCICILIVSMHAVEPRNFLNSVLLDAIVIVMMNFDMIFNDFTWMIPLIWLILSQSSVSYDATNYNAGDDANKGNDDSCSYDTRWDSTYCSQSIVATIVTIPIVTIPIVSIASHYQYWGAIRISRRISIARRVAVRGSGRWDTAATSATYQLPLLIPLGTCVVRTLQRGTVGVEIAWSSYWVLGAVLWLQAHIQVMLLIHKFAHFQLSIISNLALSLFSINGHAESLKIGYFHKFTILTSLKCRYLSRRS